jgi:hypothetical protein
MLISKYLKLHTCSNAYALLAQLQAAGEISTHRSLGRIAKGRYQRRRS